MAAANVDHADRAGRHRGHGRPRRSGVKVDPGRHRGQDTRYNAHFHARAQKEKKEKWAKKEKFTHFFFLLREEILGGGKVGWRVALSPLENGDRERWPPRPGYSQLGGVGQVEPDK